MAEYLVTDTELRQVADAIRTKGGTSGTLIFPSGYTSAIAAIETGVDTSDATATADSILSGMTAYVNGQKLTGTIAFKAAERFTPGTSVQVIQAGVYLSGSQTIAGDVNLLSENIRSGVSIFGVVGTMSDGGSAEIEDAFLTRTYSTVYENSRVTQIAPCVFYWNLALQEVYFPACTEIGSSAFYSCSALSVVSFPVCERIRPMAFVTCTSLESVFFPSCVSIGYSAFVRCTSLTTINFPVCKSISSMAFFSCSALSSVLIPECTFVGYSAFAYCTSLTEIDLPACSLISNYAFMRCSKLVSISAPLIEVVNYGTFSGCISLSTMSVSRCTNISGHAFAGCVSLISLFLLGSSVANLTASVAFSSTPIGGYSYSAGQYGSIYVRESLYNTYSNATNWIYYRSRFVGLSDVQIEILDNGGRLPVTQNLDTFYQTEAQEGVDATLVCDATAAQALKQYMYYNDTIWIYDPVSGSDFELQYSEDDARQGSYSGNGFTSSTAADYTYSLYESGSVFVIDITVTQY